MKVKDRKVDEKKIGVYTVRHSLPIGGDEILLGVCLEAEYPFLVCRTAYDDPFDMKQIAEAKGTDSWIDAVKLFCNMALEHANETLMAHKTKDIKLSVLDMGVGTDEAKRRM